MHKANNCQHYIRLFFTVNAHQLSTDNPVSCKLNIYNLFGRANTFSKYGCSGYANFIETFLMYDYAKLHNIYTLLICET